MHSKKTTLIACVLLVCVLLASVGNYMRTASDTINEESSAHLHEMYGQVNSVFTTLATTIRGTLRDWGTFSLRMIETGNEDVLASTSLKCKEGRKFSKFYFLSKDGTYVDIEGNKGTIRLSNVTQIVHDVGEYIVDVAIADGKDKQNIFILTVDPMVYEGQEISAIALAYEIETLKEMVGISTLPEDVHCCIVSGDGNIILSSYAELSVAENYYAFLKSRVDFDTGTFEDFYDDVHTADRGSYMVQVDDEDNFLIYQSLQYQDWFLLGISPESIVNAGMRSVQQSAMYFLITISLVAFALVFWVMYIRHKHSINTKETEIAKQDSMITTLANGATDAFIMYTPERVVKYVSPNMERISGVTAEDVKADLANIANTCVSPDAAAWQTDIDNLQLGESVQVLHEHINPKTGDRCWYQKTVYRLEDLFFLVMSDRTKETESHRQLELSMELIKSANKSKSDFLANMSHDIRTPLNAIIGFSALLSHDADNPTKVEAHAKKITTSGQHLLSLINDVLDMSKIESGKASLNVAEFSLSGLLEDIDSFIGAQARAKNQEFEIQMYGVQAEFIVGDRTRINQILINLLSNAVKYTHEGGNIELIISQVGSTSGKISHLNFQVKDNGMGMSQEYLDIIFDPFTREENSTISGIQGTGLGMAITKNLVDLMGGTIFVKSQKGMGTTITVNLPLTLASYDEDTDFWKDRQIDRILIVDDEEKICRDIKASMSKTGVDVMYTVDSTKTVKLIQAAISEKRPYNIVLIDRKMQQLSGLDTARRIIAEFGDKAPLILLLAYDWSEIEEEAYEIGIKAFLPKPFFMTNFRRVVETLFDVKTQKEAVVSEGASPLSQIRILAAEDNALNAEILSELLSIEDIACDIAENGEVAVEMFRNSEPGYYDIIFMDIQMPVMDGYAATRAIRLCGHPDAKTIPISAMTANAFEEDIQSALDAGMNTHLSKPVDLAVMKAVILQLLER